MAHIVIVLDRFDPARGGLERWASQLASWLAGAGYKVHIVSFGSGPSAAEKGVLYHRLGEFSGCLEKAEAVQEALGRLSPDLVHDLGVGWSYDILQPQAGSRLANLRQDLRSRPLGERWRKRLSPSHLRRLREWRVLEKRQYAAGRGAIIAVSRLVRNHLRLRYQIDPSRLRLIPNGIDLEAFRPEKRAAARAYVRARLDLDREVLFLFAGHNYRLKGLETALRALMILGRTETRPFRLAVLGRGPIEAFRETARRLRIADRVTFCGFVEQAEPYFLAADVFIHPTFYDACSLAVLEALAAGLPVVTTAFNGAAEWMVPGLQGFILDDPRDAPGLAGSMKLLLDDSFRIKISREARALGAEFSLEKNFREVESVYKEFLRA